MSARSAARRRAEAARQVRPPIEIAEAGARVARPSFHPPANDNRMPLPKLIAEWSAVLAVGTIAAALIWWLVV